MIARLPFRPSHFFLCFVLTLLLPMSMLAGPGGSGSGGGHGGGGGHSGGGHSGGGHVGGHMGGAGSGSHSGSASSVYAASGAPLGGHGGPFYGSAGGSNAGPVSSESGAGGHFAYTNTNFVRDATTEASLTHMAGQGWHFLPSAGVRPVAQPVRNPLGHAPASLMAAHPAVLPVHPHHHGPYVFGSFPYWGTFGGPGFGFGGGCFFNGFTNVCGPGGGYSPFMGPCPRFGFPGCGPTYPGYGWGSNWWLGGQGWGGYGGYGLNGDFGYDQGETPMAQEDSAPPRQEMDIIGGYYGDTPPGDVSVANTTGSASSGQGSSAAVPSQLIFKDGSSYAVKAYWVSGHDLYYQPVYGGLNHIPLDQFDLSATVDANTRAGVPFTLSTAVPQK
jgi:hypothetical protein